MYFNFPIFEGLARRVCRETGIKPCEARIEVCRYYFQTYEDTLHRVHPNIRIGQIKRILEAMPYIEGGNTTYAEGSGKNGAFTVGDYKRLTDKHFQTEYHDCDYNINHFFSGDIRLYRYYETIY